MCDFSDYPCCNDLGAKGIRSPRDSSRDLNDSAADEVSACRDIPTFGMISVIGHPRVAVNPKL